MAFSSEKRGASVVSWLLLRKATSSGEDEEDIVAGSFGGDSCTWLSKLFSTRAREAVTDPDLSRRVGLVENGGMAVAKGMLRCSSSSDPGKAQISSAPWALGIAALTGNCGS
jgi:hypothetical protein